MKTVLSFSEIGFFEKIRFLAEVAIRKWIPEDEEVQKMDDSYDTEYIPVKLPNGATVKVEVSQAGRQDVAATDFLFKPVTEIIEGLAESLTESLARFKPDKATITFGLEMAVESGGLTAMIVKGAGKGNLKIGLEWTGENLKEMGDGKDAERLVK